MKVEICRNIFLLRLEPLLASAYSVPVDGNKQRKVEIGMYELKNGSARLVYALDGIKDDEAVLLKLANALNYVPEQLQQDITALNDFYEIARNKEAEKP